VEDITLQISLNVNTLEFFNQNIDLIGALANPKNDLPKQSKTEPQYGDPWVRECIRNAEMKLGSKLFTCQIIIRSIAV
jgi:hypothetical protein